MALTPAEVQAIINAEIEANGIGAITGPVLNGVLTDIVNLFYVVSGTTLAGLTDVSIVEGSPINNFVLTWNESQNAWIASLGGSSVTGTVTLRQFKLALAAINQMETITASIPADVNNAINIEWTSSSSVIPGDSLANSVQTTLGYTNSQMASLFASAAIQIP